MVLFVRRATTGYGSLTLPSPLPTVRARASGRPEVLLAVGDVASCYSPADEAVADLASRLPGTIALLGDTAYESGTTEEYANCFEPGLGTDEIAHPPGHRQPRIPDRGRERLLRLLRRGGRSAGRGLVLVRPGRMAHRGAELELQEA